MMMEIKLTDSEKGKDKQRYWYCLIGPFDTDKLPDGSDAPLRQAVQKAFAQLTGSEADLTSSGWGINEEQKDRIQKVSVGSK